MERSEPVSTVKKIYDEVHGYIGLSEPEIELVDTPTFQRLRYIRQLAAAWYVYPGATHTRFSHSLGVLHLMGIIAKKLYTMGFIHYKDDVQLLRLVALLHDIGHTPFSHAIEPFYMQRLGVRHEDITRIVILRDPYINEILEKYGYDPKEIVSILEGKHKEKLYTKLISSDLDVDRMDYLLRDALHTGVTYGTIDIHRLVETLVVDGEGNLALLYKGLNALENFYLARLHMYRAVYYHKTIVGYELLLRKIYEKLCLAEVDDQLLFRSLEDIVKAVEEGLFGFWHDSWLLGLLIRLYKQERISRDVRKLIEAFLFRKGYKVLKDLSSFGSKELDFERDEDIRKLREIVEAIRSKLVGVSDDDVVVFVEDIDVIKDDPASIPHVVIEGVGSIPVTELRSSIIFNVPRKYHVKRLYVLSDIYSKVQMLEL